MYVSDQIAALICLGMGNISCMFNCVYRIADHQVREIDEEEIPRIIDEF